MIYTIGTVPESRLYTPSSFEHFLDWESAQLEFELDVETTVSPWWCDKQLITMQFGSVDGRTQWFLRWLDLSEEQKEHLKRILENPRKTKLIHNALFEYVVLRFSNIKLENVYDTMLAEQVLFGGITSEKGESLYSLKALVLKYCCVEMDKTLQMSFNEEPLSAEQVLYACDDVMYLSAIRRMQIPELKSENSENTAALEMEAVLGYGDMTYNGIELNTHDWLENLKFADPLIESTRKELEQGLFQEPKLYHKAIELGYLSEQDRLEINWNSANQKKQLLGWMCEDLEMYTKAYIQKFLKASTFGDDIDQLLFDMMDKEYEGLNKYLVANYRPSLIREGYLIPAGQSTLNWNSQDQVLPLAKAVEPKLQGLSKEDIAKTSHWILPILQEYKANLKLKTTYGEKFIEDNLEPDGKIRTRYNQIISTGRISSSKPNLQNIPAKESVGNRYRNAFTCPSDWVYCDSDYASQELVIIAYLSQDPVWMDALRKGQDLHSICAEMVYKQRWKDATQPGCQYYLAHTDKKGKQWPENSKLKCDCKVHKRYRSATKSIDFGLAYGMSEFKLAGDQRISLKEAKALINEYFTVFPKIGSILNYFGNFGVTKGYIQTIWPFFRKRIFPEWKYIRPHIIEAHTSGVQYNPTLGSIERQSKNHPIQGSSADITKTSLVLIRKFLNENKLNEDIKMVVQVHDQNTSICKDEIAEWWKPELTRLMEEAAYFIIPNGLLLSDTNISARWSK